MSVILIWQGGGPSHLDMWDLKPKAPAEFRGSFNPIASNLPGFEVGEHMPRIAQICDKLTVLRSVTHPDSGHESATHFLLTGYPPTNDIPSNEVPSYGSIVGKELGANSPVCRPTPRFPAPSQLGGGVSGRRAQPASKPWATPATTASRSATSPCRAASRWTAWNIAARCSAASTRSGATPTPRA